MQERIEKLTMDWFLMEPALLKVLMSHNVTENTGIKCPVRCGKRRIEYNPDLCQSLPDEIFTEMMKAECIRILLKHPYERQPQHCSQQAITGGSNCVLADNYKFRSLSLSSPKDLGLKSGMHFEYYANALSEQHSQQLQQESGDSGDEEEQQEEQHSEGTSNNKQAKSGNESQNNNDSQSIGESQNSSESQESGESQNLSDQSQLWEEDSLAAGEINEMIHTLEASRNWGSISSNLAGQIIASSHAKIDYRRVLQLFRTEVLSSKRRLTRMRPNRRSGFENYGSVYRLTSRLLVAIDVSGSTTDQMVSDFFGVVNRFFKYGIEDIDVIQFDAAIKGEPMSMKKAKKYGINIVGRGGTDFQPVFDYAAEQKGKYQGLIIFTDGYAPAPTPPEFFNTPVLWVLSSKDLYNEHKNRLKQTGKVCFIETK